MNIFQKMMQVHIFNPQNIFGAIFYALVFLIVAIVASRALTVTVGTVLKRDERGLIDRTVASFLTQIARIGIYLIALILYAHLIPALSRMGTALLAGAGVATAVFGLAAQNTLGNIIAGISLLLHRPFEVGDRVQVTAVTGLETGTVERLALGYTILRTDDQRKVLVPNSVMASQVMVRLAGKDKGRSARIED